MELGSAFEVRQSQINGVTWIRLAGKLVAGEGERSAHRVFEEALAEGRDRLLVDLKDVNAIDSSGVGELLILRSRAEELGAQVRLIHLHHRVRKILEIARLTSMFEIHDEDEKAMASFG